MMSRPLSPFMLKLLGNAGVPVLPEETEDEWPQVLYAASMVIQKAYMQGLVNNGHLASFGQALIAHVLLKAPESERGRMLDDLTDTIRKAIVPE
jgi:hypothetical protein